MNADQFWHDIQDLDSPPLVLPDIGTFFNQDMSVAQTLFNQVAQSGVRYIKGEILHDADICLVSEQLEQFLDKNAQATQENYRELIERKTVSLTQYRQLFAPCQEKNLGLVLSVYDNKGVDFAQEIGACALKIASTNIVHAPLIRYCAKSNLPLLIDSGKATIEEAKRAIDWAIEAGAKKVILQYSPPAPPAEVSQHNLNVLPWLKSQFCIPVGLSDHHAGEEMFYAATVLGARILEKGVCPDNQDSDQDAFHALPVSQLAGVRSKCHNIFKALGTAKNAYQAPPKRPAARMGMVAKKSIAAGELFSDTNIRFAFPTQGVAVEDWDSINGKAALKDIAANRPVEWHHVVNT